MFPSRIKAKLARNEPALAVCLHLTDPTVHEMVGMMGFDGIWLDMEHHVYSLETAQEAMRGARIGSGADILCRPAKGEFMRLARMLEAGAHGILYPRCSDPQEAAQVVQAMKFAPLGQRGFDGGNRDMPFCTMDMAEYLQFANDNTFLFIQIEEPSAADQAEAILSVEGVDGLFFGPADFSILSGTPGQFDTPAVTKGLRQVVRAAQNTGKHWGMPAGTFERTKELLDMGARLICHGADVLMIKNALEKIQEDFAELGFRFDNRMPNAKSYMEQV